MGSRWFRAGTSLMFLVTLVSAAHAQWGADGALVCGALGDQRAPVAITDGAGGAIVVWEDPRDGATDITTDIYAQRINAGGHPMWAADGIAICAFKTNQITPSIVSDGAGGAIIVWEDLRSGISDLYAQRIDAAGAVQWAANGVVACGALGQQHNPVAIADGAGGAIVTWWDQRGTGADVYAQRLGHAGNLMWFASGVAITGALGDQVNPLAVSDGARGAIVVWSDTQVRAQRVDSLGATHWGADGTDMSVVVAPQFSPSVVGDGAGGAIVTWIDMRSGTDQDVWGQRLNAAGVWQWGDSARAVCANEGYQFGASAISDGAGGALVAWRDLRGSILSTDLYAQRVGPDGLPLWAPTGVALCTVDGDQQTPAIALEDGGSAIVAWHDLRSGGGDVYARGVTGLGAIQWAAGGVPLCAAVGDQQSVSIVADGKGGAIVIWEDARSGVGSDLYAARVAGDGILVPTLVALASATAGPDRVRLVWHGSERAGRAASVERRTTATDFEVVATIVSDASGALTYEDVNVRPGARYAYRLAIGEGASVTRTEATWIEVPMELALAFEGARPNPVERDLVLAFTLPRPAPARLEIFDVRGRRMVARTVSLGAGRHVMRIDEAAAMPGGLYVARLAQGGASASLKLLVRR